MRKIAAIILFIISISPCNTSAQWQKVNSNGLDVYYRIFGEGIPLLIVGGGPGTASDSFLDLCDFLPKDYKCILVEQRGVGKSAPEVLDTTTITISLTLKDFEVLREHLGFKQWNVLGYSYGGFLSSLYAHFYPSSIESLILMSSLGLNTKAFPYFLDNIITKLSSDDKALLKYWNDSAVVAHNPKHAMVERIKVWMPGYFYDREKSIPVAQAMKDENYFFEMGDWIWRDVFSKNLDLEKMECTYNNPVLILHGRQDPLGESVPINIDNHFNNSKLVVIEKAGHYLWIEQPDVTYDVINKFLTTDN